MIAAIVSTVCSVTNIIVIM